MNERVGILGWKKDQRKGSTAANNKNNGRSKMGVSERTGEGVVSDHPFIPTTNRVAIDTS
jgi:hypothetical protein